MAALKLAVDRKTPIFGIVGRDGGTTARLADAAVVIPPLFADHITPHTEGLCAVVWHLLVTHPVLARSATKWESVEVTSAVARVVVVGGAGFIGSHFVEHLLGRAPPNRSRCTTTSPPAVAGTSPPWPTTRVWTWWSATWSTWTRW